MAHTYNYINIKICKNETSKYFNTTHLYHVHTIINNENQHPKQQCQVTGITVS
jgi:hypothetical protein